MNFNIKCIGKLPGPTNQFEQSLEFETGEFELPKFDCTEVRIGSINIPHVTVADDLAGFTRRHRDMQVMVLDIENNTERERYCVNPNKSSYLCFNIPKHETQGIDLVMSGENIPCDECTIHLGIIRDIKNKVHIEEKLSLGRKTSYSLFTNGGGVSLC